MKFIKTIVLFILLTPVLSYAQKNELLLSLSGGINYPMGEFASTAYTITDENTLETQGQFAKLGSAFDFSLNYRLGYYLGFSGRIMGGTNKVNNTAYSDAFKYYLE